MDRPAVTFTARILRKAESLPRYVVVTQEHLGGRIAAFPADVRLNDVGPFRRNIRPWGKGSDVFFFNPTAPQCSKAGLDTHEMCRVTLIPQD